MTRETKISLRVGLARIVHGDLLRTFRLPGEPPQAALADAGVVVRRRCIRRERAIHRSDGAGDRCAADGICADARRVDVAGAAGDPS